MIGRIEEFLEEKNNLYGAIIILLFICGAIVYYVNINILQAKIEDLDQKIEKEKSSIIKARREYKSFEKKLANLKASYKKNSLKNRELKEDIKYLNYSLSNSNVLLIDDKSFYDILDKILFYSKKNHLDSNFVVKEFNNDLKYKITINGECDVSNYKGLLNFIKNIEGIKKIKNISLLNIKKGSDENKLNFEILLNFWSIK